MSDSACWQQLSSTLDGNSLVVHIRTTSGVWDLQTAIAGLESIRRSDRWEGFHRDGHMDWLVAQPVLRFCNALRTFPESPRPSKSGFRRYTRAAPRSDSYWPY